MFIVALKLKIHRVFFKIITFDYLRSFVYLKLLFFWYALIDATPIFIFLFDFKFIRRIEYRQNFLFCSKLFK